MGIKEHRSRQNRMLLCGHHVERGAVYLVHEGDVKGKATRWPICVECSKDKEAVRRIKQESGRAREPAPRSTIKRTGRIRGRFDPLLVGHVVHGLGRMGA